MGLRDAIDTESNRHGKRLCPIGALIKTMDEEDQQAFEIAKQQIQLNRQDSPSTNQYAAISSNAVWRALKSEGHFVSRDAVNKHIADTCVCRSL
jgi:ribosomal protein L9